MKEYTKEDIKMGSIWRDKTRRDVRATVTRIDGRTVFYHYKSDSSEFSELSRLINGFLYAYEPVYTVEGFEV